MRGKRVGARRRRSGEPARSIDLGATIRAACDRHAVLNGPGSAVRLRQEDLHHPLRQAPPRRLVIFLMDCSDSMGDGPEERMAAALGAALALTGEAYLNRDQVSLIGFRDRDAQILVPPTDSVELVRNRLRRLPIGGGTPLAAGLQTARRLISQVRSRDKEQEVLLVMITDCEATVALQVGADPAEEALAEAAALARSKARVLLISTQTPGRNSSLLPRLAETLGTRCHQLHALRSDQLLELIDRTEPRETS